MGEGVGGQMISWQAPPPERLRHAVKDWKRHSLFVVFAAEACSTSGCCFQDPPYPDAGAGLGQFLIAGRGHAGV